MIRRILAPIDLSTISEPLISLASDLARPAGVGAPAAERGREQT